MEFLKSYFDLYNREEVEDIYNALKLRIDDLRENIDHLECFTEDLSDYLEELDV